MLTLKTLQEINPKATFVSFDIFDTLLTRSCATPSDVFDEMENRLINSGERWACGFAKSRIASEKRARRVYGGGVNIDNIYSSLPRKYKNNNILLKQLEFEIELEWTIPIQETIALVNECRSVGLGVIAISDMYLSSCQIRKLLNSVGVTIDRIYVSSETSKTKRDGSLFPFVLEDLGIDAKKIIHIGDNAQSDVASARHYGIQSILFDRKSECHYPFHLPHYMKGIVDEISNKEIFRFIKSYEPSGLTRLEKLGFETLGPLLLGFCEWVKNQCNNDGSTSIFFLSRDGLVIKRAYEEWTGQSITAHYLYASRKAFLIPALHLDSDLNAVLQLMDVGEKGISIDVFLEKLGIKEDIDLCALEEYGCYPYSTIGVNEDCFQRFLPAYEAIIRPVLDPKAKEQYVLFAEYLRQEGFFSEVIPTIVDIGWNGNMQNALQLVANSILQTKCAIKGYYLGIKKKKRISPTKVDGFIFNENSEQNALKCHASYYTSLIELFFSTNHGTVLGYKKNEGKIFPVLSNFEGTSESDNWKIVSEIQSGAVLFCMLAHQSDFTAASTLDPASSYAGIWRIGSSPMAAEVELLGGLKHEDGVVYELAAPKKAKYYLFHPKDLVKDFKKSAWRIGFLKKLIKWDFDYLALYEWLRKRI